MTSPSNQPSESPRPRVVIIGGGFGGLNAAQALRDAPVEITLLDRTNHHLFQPLLYQVATATLPPSDITAPLRSILRHQKNVTVLLGEASGIDVTHKTVQVKGQPDLPYDYLLVAAGARHSYFGHPEWEALAPGLKSIDDALEIRRRFLMAFEKAEEASDEEDRSRYLTFVIVGGGPTGVELAGIMIEIARQALREDFRRIDTARTHIILLEGGPRILPAFPDSLSLTAKKNLEDFGVEVRTGEMVTRIEPDAVWVGDERIGARTVFWAAGNAASPLAKSLGVPLDKAGRVEVNADLSVPGHPEIFVVGDLALVLQRGKPVPGVAQGAIQGGQTAAENIRRSLAGEARIPFRYFDKGNLATIGRDRGIADLRGLHLSGRLGWWLWLTVHILFLIGFRNRASVLLQWAISYLTYQRSSRLITHIDPPQGVPEAANTGP
ncbi:NADH dehydrogenase [Capsulimonas corticalis]|uniref:NADH:ubiquinone reductase (non-electrogenic) n=1 Tax=Capsulimonas corticalis TaxID=2219043 RepID=A0A402CUB8_9BACT|nr:NAD(P)/FAD-dependent oxidoreductase [Capsulimonas corticalis]BDI28907.1 NADH dehydrogenase [Capsulimonas corticalis]